MDYVYRLLLQTVAAGLLLAALPAAAQVNVTLPWVRATTQKSAVVFLQLEAHAAAGVALTGATSPLAKSVAIVEPRRHPGGTNMHAVQRLEVAAGSKLELKPGKPQLMLTGLTQPLIQGDHIPLTLNFDTPGGPLAVDISAEVVAKHAKTAIDHEHEHEHEHDHQH
jgi:periplasmic copper chaperone A